MIKAIIFDLGGVLFTNGTKSFLEYLQVRFGTDFETGKDILNSGKIGTDYREGKINRDEFWDLVLEKLQIDDDRDILEDEWISRYALLEKTRDIILELNKNYKVYYLSDTPRERLDRLHNKHEFLNWFTDGTIPQEIGVRKPHPDVYKAAIDKAEVLPEEIVFIDDLEKNLKPAEELGMKTILFETPEKLRDDLIKFGVTL